MTKRFLITCAPPNPNGDLHLGHLSGPFLGADVLRRYLAARDLNVAYVSYTDDHSVYVPRRGSELGMGARRTAHVFTQRIEQTLALADQYPDYYAHPHRDTHYDQIVREHFLRLYKNGVIEEREMAVPYCETCDSFQYEAFLRGRCRFCQAPSDGTYCEECGFPQDPEGLLDPVCVRCGGRPTTRVSRRLVVPLAAFADQLSALVRTSSWRPRVRDYVSGLLQHGLPVVPISRQTGYGLPVPLDGWQGHILDTWFCGIFGYVAASVGYGAALGEPELWQELWRDPETVLVHFIGFDCGFSHAVLWPALLLGLGDYITPAHIISNEFYTLDGEKFSTSRGHAIWGADFLREAAPDAVRLHLALTNPETTKSDFRMADFDHTVNTVLVGELEQWAASLFRSLAANSDARIPDTAPADWPQRTRALIARTPVAVASALEPDCFSLREAARALTEAINAAAADLRAHLAAGQPGRGVLTAHAELLGVLSASAAPLMPGWARHARRQLGVPTDLRHIAWPEQGRRAVASGTRLPAVYRPLFQAR